jgi:hypothetical protein
MSETEFYPWVRTTPWSRDGVALLIRHLFTGWSLVVHTSSIQCKAGYVAPTAVLHVVAKRRLPPSENTSLTILCSHVCAQVCLMNVHYTFYYAYQLINRTYGKITSNLKFMLDTNIFVMMIYKKLQGAESNGKLLIRRTQTLVLTN